MNTLSKSILSKLAVLASRKGLTPRQLQRNTGLAYSTCWKLLHGKAKVPALKSVMLFAKACGVSLGIQTKSNKIIFSISSQKTPGSRTRSRRSL